MRSAGLYLLALLGAAQATYTHYATLRCECNGRSRYCERDAWGLRCLNCEGNTEGRHCERCRPGFYLQGGSPSCTACLCHPAGSLSSTCDSRGRCSCKVGVKGEKCDRCANGSIGPDGCPQTSAPKRDSACFCYGHSSRCSVEPGFSIYNITSTFSTGSEDWKAATKHGAAAGGTFFSWSPQHQDLGLISVDSTPVYFYAPNVFLGNQLTSYGQNFSFLLRLDRGDRRPSAEDLILEGGGLRVAASLGNPRCVIAATQRIHYSFRLDERPGSRWRPHLSSFQFQTLLQNLTAIKIRATFGENGRGYLDDVNLVSARLGRLGVPARWVQTCVCPQGYEGRFCERCAVGFKRRVPGSFGSCEPGGCDPRDKDCLFADETPGERGCSLGFYRDTGRPESCLRCPCPAGTSCAMKAGNLEPRCDRCPPGTTGSRCDVCQEGFYGDPAGSLGARRPCAPCRCNGHIDVRAAGSCDRFSGECLRCVNNTTGRSCESCVSGFYRGEPSEACQPCDCNRRGSESDGCDRLGRCRCQTGFEGAKCQRSGCPACFDPVKAKLEFYADTVQRLEASVSPAVDEASLKAAEHQVENLTERTKQVKETQEKLRSRLATVAEAQRVKGQELQSIKETSGSVQQRRQTYERKAAEVQTLIGEMNRTLRLADFPVWTENVPNGISALAQTAVNLADRHQKLADAIAQTAAEALRDSQAAAEQIRNLTVRENKTSDLIGDLKELNDALSDRVKQLEQQRVRLNAEAENQSKMADDARKTIAAIEGKILPIPQVAMTSRLEDLKENVSAILELQKKTQLDQSAAEELLAKGKAARREFQELLEKMAAAKKDVELALRRVNATETPRDFGASKNLSDAVERLPGINATIREAVRRNAQLRSVLDDASGKYDDALESVGRLQALVKQLQAESALLPSNVTLVVDSAKLNKEAEDLKMEAEKTARDIDAALDAARRREADAKQAAAEAAAALNKAEQTKDAMKKTLRDISDLLANQNRTNVDEKRLKQAETSLAEAQKEAELLTKRLRDVEDAEGARRRLLDKINLNIDSVESDIANLEEILLSVPAGCYNSPPIEEA